MPIGAIGKFFGRYFPEMEAQRQDSKGRYFRCVLDFLCWRGSQYIHPSTFNRESSEKLPPSREGKDRLPLPLFLCVEILDFRGAYSSSHNYGSGKWLPPELDYLKLFIGYFSTSMILGERVNTSTNQPLSHILMKILLSPIDSYSPLSSPHLGMRFLLARPGNGIAGGLKI